MIHQFQHHYSLQEARALLPQIRSWLQALDEHRQTLERVDRQLRKPLSEGYDLGGPKVVAWIKSFCAVKSLLREFQEREILIKDIDRGLIDFPSIQGGREVFLCWEKDEEDIEFWHELDAGYSGREPLE